MSVKQPVFHAPKRKIVIMEADNALKSLQAWCRKTTEGYRNVSVNNMTTSWRDGLAFCAIIHHFRPDLIDFDSLSPENIEHNNSLAFSVAEKQLGIPALLDAEDMVTYKVPDKLSICTYLSQFYQYFEGKDKFRYKRTLLQGEKCPGIFQKIITDQVTIGERKHEVCQTCKQRVFILERLIVDGKLYHRTCFKCSKCCSLLKPGAYIEGDDPGTYECVVCPINEVHRILKKSINETGIHESKTIQKESPSPEKEIGAKEGIKLSLLTSTIDQARQSYFQRHLNSHSSQYTDQNKLNLAKQDELRLKEKSDADNTRLLNKPSLTDYEVVSNPISFTSTECSENNLLLNTQRRDKSFENGICKETKPRVDESEMSKSTQNRHVLEKNKSSFVKPPLAIKPELRFMRRQSAESVEEQKDAYEKQKTDASPSNVLSNEFSPPENSRQSSLTSSTSSLESTPKSTGHYQSVFLSDRLSRSLKPLSLRYENDTSGADISADYSSGSQLEMPVIKSSSYKITSVGGKLPRPHSVGNFISSRKNSDPISLPQTCITMKGSSDGNISSIHNRWSKINSERELLNHSYLKKDSDDGHHFTSCNELFLKESTQKIPSYANIYRNELNKTDEKTSIKTNADDNDQITVSLKSPCEAKIKESKMKVDHVIVPVKSQGKLKESLPNITKDKDSMPSKEYIHSVENNNSLEKEKPFFATIKLKPVGERRLPNKTSEINKKPTDKILHHNMAKEMNRVNITGSDKIIPELKSTTSEKAAAEELMEKNYPDELNPFGDDDDNDDDQNVKVEPSQKYPQTLNPFGDSDDDSDGSKISTPTECTPIKNQNHGTNEEVEEEYDQSLNPFASSDDESESLSSTLSTPEMNRLSSKHSEANWRPTPAVRMSKLSPNIGNSPFPNLNQNISPLTPSPTSSLRGTQKKRRAPLPPELKDGFSDSEKVAKEIDSTLPSSQSSPKSFHSPSLNRAATLSLSPKHLHKSKPAPLPPKYATYGNAHIVHPNNIEVTDSAENNKAICMDNVTQSDINTNSSQSQQKVHSFAVGPVRKKRPAPPVPLPPRRQIKKISLKEIEAEMEEIEGKQQEFEKQGRDLEMMIRDKDKEEQTIEEEEMIIQLFDLMNQKNILFRRQAELMYIKRSQRLEEEQVELEFQIRVLLSKPANLKTEADKKHEEELLQKLLDVVEQRNEIVESIEMDRRRQAEEDTSVQEQMEVKKSDLPITAEIEEKKSGKKKKHKGKLKDSKKHSQSKQDKNNKPKK